MGLGTNFNRWLKEKGKEPLLPELEQVLNEVGREMRGDVAWKATVVGVACEFMAALLQQEYKMHEGQWWLWTLGEPARPLTETEIREHGLS